MKISNIEIARCALCTEGAVRAAVSGGRLNTEDADSVFRFVLAGRVKASGLDFADPVGDMIEKGLVKTANELGYEPDDSQMEGSW